MMNKNFIRVLFAVCAFTLAACSEDSTSPTSPEPQDNSLAKFSAIKAQVFTNCMGAQCHSSAAHQADLVLEGDAAYNNLVGVQSVLYPQFKRVEPGNSGNSLIIKILRGEVSPRMPLNGSPLPAATIDSIAKWIDQGALNN